VVPFLPGHPKRIITRPNNNKQEQQQQQPVMATTTTTRTLKFDDGAVQFRQRIAVSLLSHRNLLLRNIRNDADAADVLMGGGGTGTSSIGLRDYEVSFLRLIDALTNGTVIEINNTGTQLRFRPGTLIGGVLSVPHQCPNSNHSRSISWFLEGLWPILPFCKEAVSLTLVGITEGRCRQDASVDYWKNNLPSVLRQFGIDTITTSTPGTTSTTGTTTTTNNNHDFFDAGAGGFSLRILNRSCDGDGRVHVSCPIVRTALTPIDWTDMGRYKRIRGLVKSANASQTARVAYAAKGVLQQLLPDVWIHTERIARTTMTTARNNNDDEVEDANATADVTSRLTVTLTVESTTTCTFTTETAADRRALPEDVGHIAAAHLLHALHAQGGGVVDGGGITPLVLLYMCLTPEDVSRVRCGALSPYTIASLRLYHEAFGVEFKITPEYGETTTKTVLLSCLGTGYRNMARAST
jgi:RNA 3'-terminal phosphate cyclase-like protein